MNCLNTTLSILLIGFLISCQNNPDQNISTSDEIITTQNCSDSLTKELNEIYKQGFINGFSVAIVNRSKSLYTGGFGYSDRLTKKIYTQNTIQNIASISKTFLGIALLKAQEMGKLELDDTINKYLPFEVINPYHPDKLISIRQLATHTSTIKDTEFYGGKAYVLKDDIDESKKSIKLYVELNLPSSHMSMLNYLQKVLTPEAIWFKKEGFLKHKPGELFEYSNVGATLAALVLEMATGEPYDKFTYDYILNPLKMSSTGWSFRDVDLSKHTKLYLNPDTEIPYYSLITYPDGGLITSANDLSKYLVELIKGYKGEGILLNEKSYKDFFSKQLSPENFTTYNGENEGIFLSFASNGFIGHSGRDPGVSSFMFFDPNTELGRILLVNTELTIDGEKQYNNILDKLSEYGNKMNQIPTVD
jgi:CubicO group peptidase (beta-lactamase class C family)